MSLSESLTTTLLQVSEVLLLFSGAVLVVGLYFENKVRIWHPKAELFALLVLIGCGGELIADGGVVVFSEHLQTIEKTHISDLSKQAEEATAKAKSAKDTADAANKVSGEAKDKAGAVEGVANRALAAEADLERENAALKAKIAPRRVSGAQAKLLCSGLHAVEPTTIDMESSMGTTEPDDFAADIGRAIVACQVGLSVKLTPSVMIVPIPAPFRIAYGSKRKQDAEMISAAMVAAKIATKPIDLIPTPDNAPNTLRFFVGPKISLP